MSISNIATALEARLLTLPTMATAFENVQFTPVVGQPYQRVNLLVNEPRGFDIEASVVEQRGIFQVTLCFPLGQGSGAAQARAQAIADLFAPALTLVRGNTRVDIDRPPRIHGGSADDGRWCIPVSVYWHSFTN